jgi:hypothetical protein
MASESGAIKRDARPGWSGCLIDTTALFSPVRAVFSTAQPAGGDGPCGGILAWLTRMEDERLDLSERILGAIGVSPVRSAERVSTSALATRQWHPAYPQIAY